MVKDYWIYQERQSETMQWALYVVKETVKGKPQETTLDFTVYSEDIQTPTHSKTFVGWRYPNVSMYVNALATEMMEFTTFNAQDREQLETAITRILQD